MNGLSILASLILCILIILFLWYAKKKRKAPTQKTVRNKPHETSASTVDNVKQSSKYAGFEDCIEGYELCVTMSPDIPLKYLKRHRETRPSIPKEEDVSCSPYFIWIPKLSSDFESLTRGGTMSSSVGYIPQDGGDFLPYLIELRKIVEKPREHALSELDDVYSRVAMIQKLKCGYGYEYDENYNLLQRTKESGGNSYYDTLSSINPKWALILVLSEVASCDSDGLTLNHIEELYQKGYKSIFEIIEAPDDVLLSLKGIGQKKLAKIRANKK